MSGIYLECLQTNWKPPKPKNKNLIEYFTKTEQDITDFIKNNIFQNIKPNLCREENHTLKTMIKNNKDIILKKADKGGAIVIMDKLDYISKVENTLKIINHTKS